METGHELAVNKLVYPQVKDKIAEIEKARLWIKENPNDKDGIKKRRAFIKMVKDEMSLLEYLIRLNYVLENYDSIYVEANR